MSRRSRRQAEAHRKQRADDQARVARFYVHVKDELGPEKPLGVLRVRGYGPDAEAERIGPGVVWKPTWQGLAHIERAEGHSAVRVDESTAQRLAARWAWTYRRIVDRSSGSTVAYSRFVIDPSNGLVSSEESTCTGVWEPAQRIFRIQTGQDDLAVEPIDAATIEERLRDRPQPEYRYFAVLQRNGDWFSLDAPPDLMRIRTGEHTDRRERLGDDWEPYDMIDGVRGLRDEKLLEIDEAAVPAFRLRLTAGADRPERQYTYYHLVRHLAVVRQWRDGDEVHEEKVSGGPQWTRANYSGRESRAGDPDAVEISAGAAEGMTASWRYRYFEIYRPNDELPIAVVRRNDAEPYREEAAVGWPAWAPSLWLKQIAEGKVAYRAVEADADAAERYLRRVAVGRPEYRYFAFLDDGESIDTARWMSRIKSDETGYPLPWTEETPLEDGRWLQTRHLLEVNHGRGSWWLDPVEVPEWLFERYRVRKQVKRARK
jgi:hypothetical protein